MDFGTISSMSSSKSSMKRKQSHSLLQAFRGSRDRQSSAPVNPPTSYTSVSASSSPQTYTSPEMPSSPYADSSYSNQQLLPPNSQASISSADSSSQRKTSERQRYIQSLASSGGSHESERNISPSLASGSRSPTAGGGGQNYQPLLPTASEVMMNTSQSGGGSNRNPPPTNRTVSGSTSQNSDGHLTSNYGKGKERASATVIKRPEDVFKLTRDRLFGWSFLMQWYQGDVHWFNTVKISRSIVESSLGASKMETRARNFFVLGMSLAPLFDIPGIYEFLRAVLKLLEEWESWAEGSGGKVRNLFRAPRGKKPGSGSGDHMFSDYESVLINVHMPFTPDFYQVHSSTCSIIRDIYKKVLRSVLPNGGQNNWIPPHHDGDYNLHHPSTIIHSAPLEGAGPFPPPPPPPSSLPPTSPAPATASNVTIPASSTSAFFPIRNPPLDSTNRDSLGPTPRMEELGITATPVKLTTNSKNHGGGSVQMDGFQALIAGELPPDRTLAGDGQRLTASMTDVLLKVDGKLKKHFSVLIHEGHELARQTLDSEMSSLLNSLQPGTTPLKFDISAALSQQGNGFSADPSLAPPQQQQNQHLAAPVGPTAPLFANSLTRDPNTLSPRSAKSSIAPSISVVQGTSQQGGQGTHRPSLSRSSQSVKSIKSTKSAKSGKSGRSSSNDHGMMSRMAERALSSPGLSMG